MKSDIVISIIVPIYNCEKYISACIESVLEQTYKYWELIIIDDGSTDKSPMIIDDFATRDNRIVTIHKENGGEFSSRFVGISVAHGEYITGIDADDEIGEDYLEQIVASINMTNADCILCAYQQFGIKTSEIFTVVKSGTALDKRGLLYEIISTGTPSFCCKVIKRKCFIMTDYDDIPKARMAEDYLMVIPALCNVTKAYSIDSAVYKYRVHSASASFRYNMKVVEDLGDVSEFGLKILASKGLLDDELEKEIYVDYLRSIAHRIWHMAYDGTLLTANCEKVRKSRIFKKSAKYEKMSILPPLIFVIIKLFRYDKLNIIRFLARVRLR